MKKSRQHRLAPNRSCRHQLWALILVAATAAAETTTGPARVFRIDLTQAQVVDGRPAPHHASGTATLSIEPQVRTLGRVDIDGIDATRVTLHVGHAGEAGSIVAEFAPLPDHGWLLHEEVVLDAFPYAAGGGAGLYVRVESDSGVLRGQVVDAGWHVTVARLTEGAMIPQLPAMGEAIAGLTIRPDDGSYYVRLTTARATATMRARIRTSHHEHGSTTVADLQPSAHTRGVWGSADISDDCRAGHLPPDAVRAYREGRLLLEIDSFDGSRPMMRARLLPPPQLNNAITNM